MIIIIIFITAVVVLRFWVISTKRSCSIYSQQHNCQVRNLVFLKLSPLQQQFLSLTRVHAHACMHTYTPILNNRGLFATGHTTVMY